jgi:hypothetical protein
MEIEDLKCCGNCKHSGFIKCSLKIDYNMGKKLKYDTKLWPAEVCENWLFDNIKVGSRMIEWK